VVTENDWEFLSGSHVPSDDVYRRHPYQSRTKQGISLDINTFTRFKNIIIHNAKAFIFIGVLLNKRQHFL